MTKSPELLAVVNPTKCPPGGWRWSDPDTGVSFDSLAYVDLVRKVEAYFKANGLEQPGNWREVLDDQICRQNGIEDTHCGQPTKPTPIPADRKLGPHDLLAFLRTIRQWVAKGFDFASPEEAERRASVCASCPHNVEVSGCDGCLGILNYVRDILNQRANHRGLQAKTTTLDDKLKNCEVCGCVLAVKVHLPLEVAAYAKPAGGRTYPSHCWMSQPKPDDSDAE